MAQAPPLTQSDAVTSLLSLSLTASMGASPSPRQHPTLLSTPSHKHHRRLGSTGKARRRLSDAREACNRPLLASSTAALSLASLSLSASPPSTTHTISTSFGGICKPLAPKPHSRTTSIHIISGSAPNPVNVPLSDNNNFSLLASAATAAPPASKATAGNAENHYDNTTSATPIPISNGKAGTKKRGVDYKCESCSKVYRHPNCLNKHRWEHTRQWREASKFVLSKHQQVQLLEAAAILSFMGKQPASLPEDRSEWPSFLSGGSLPKVESVVPSTSTSASSIPSASSLVGDRSDRSSASSTSNVSHFPTTTTSSTTPTHHHHPISASVPNPQPSGPRLHDYALKTPGGKVVVTQVRPGLLLGVNNDPPSSHTTGTAADQFTPTRVGFNYDYGHTPPVVSAPTLGSPNGNHMDGNDNNSPTWSLPNSSMRSHGRSLSSFSGSMSAQSEDGDIEIDDVDVDDEGYEREGGRGRGRVTRRNGRTEGMGVGDMDNDEDDDDEPEEDEEDDKTGNEIYTHYSSRYHAPARMDMTMGDQQQQQMKSTKWDGVGDMDMDMDMD